MSSRAQLLAGRVMHKRLRPRLNSFLYDICYMLLPLDQLDALPIPHNRFGLISFYDKDHGPCDGRNLLAWIKKILDENQVPSDGEIQLIALPRLFGYVFNPVSFWLCFDRLKALRAVLCEVNNTYGERHSYLCVRPDRAALSPDEWLEGQKQFHVSPFLRIEGRYKFRFIVEDGRFTAHINQEDEDGQTRLLTSLSGSLSLFTKKSLLFAYLWQYPLITIKVIALIHWQAIKLVAKKIPFIPKPPPPETELTITTRVTEL